MTSPPQPKKTIGELSSNWALLLKGMLICFMPWASYITVNQVLDNQFRGAGDRFTAQDAQRQTESIFARMDVRMVKIEQKLSNMVPSNMLATQADYVDVITQVAVMENQLERILNNLESGKTPTDVFKKLEALEERINHPPGK